MNIEEEYKRWLKNSTMEKELNSLSDLEIQECFYKELEFGTGGIRALMGAGPNRLNIYTIRKNTEGYARYIESCGDNAKRKGIVIAYDNRYNSKQFAYEAAKVLASHEIYVYLFDDLRPTPELSFAVRFLKAFGGIVITASHNPPNYNGYKIYDLYGCQCVPRDTDIIIDYIKGVGDSLSVKIKNYNHLYIKNIGEEIDEAYYTELIDIQENDWLDKSKIKIVYTPLHGTGYIPVSTILERLGYILYKVDEQCIPDPFFSHTKSPNPEEKVAFEEAINLASKNEVNLILATDPDSDRLGVVVKHNDQYEYLSGNQIGVIILYYIVSQKAKKGILPENGIVFNSIVTSDLGAKICKKYNVKIESTLTGFKYIGDKIREYGNKKTFLFGYEESCGYLIKDICRDKDAIQASVFIAEIYTYYFQQGKTLIDLLNDIYTEFGYVEDIQENKLYTGINGQKKIENIINEYRYNMPKEIEGRKVVAKEDYLLSIREDGKHKSKLHLPKSNVIKLILDDDSWVVIRPSGNEPKIKYYKNLWRKN